MDHWPKSRHALPYALICLTMAFYLASAAMPSFLWAQSEQTASIPLDLVFVIDNSGSMKKNDPEFLTRQAVKEFIDRLPEQSRVGMVLFDEKIRLLHRLRLISSPRVQQQFIETLDKIDYKGRYTNSPGGIERAMYELKTNGRIDSRKAVVFITDGLVTTGSRSKNRELTRWLKEDLSRELKQQGVRVYGIAFTEAADFSLIQTMASRTNGEYFRAQDATEIAGAFQRIHHFLKPEVVQQPPLEPLPMLTPSENEPPADPADTPVVVVAQTPWMLYVWLAVISVMLAAAVILFLTKHNRSSAEKTQSTQPVIGLPKANLEDLDNACRGSTTSLKLDKAIVGVGRGLQNDICIPQATISKHHATIEYKNLAFYVTDLKSTNGTRINGEKIPPHEPIRLKNSDRVRFGKFRFQFDLPEQIPFSETILVSRTSLNDPEDQATIMIDLDESNSPEALVTCLQHHIVQIEALGPKFKSFVRRHLDYETLENIAKEADQNLKKSQDDLQLHYNSLVKKNIFYLICSLPVGISDAGNWYGATYGGFTQFALQWVRSETYRAAQCDMMSIVTFGQTPTNWVSITIVPTHDDPDPVEIISVDFLNPEEKAALALDPAEPPSGETHA